MPSRIIENYKKKIVPALQEQFGYKNISSVPKVHKVVVNVGTGKLGKEPKVVERIEKDLAKVTGQKPSVRNAKKSIAGFKLREGVPVGLTVTLRGGRMYDFIDRLVSIALPRSRDFQGIPNRAFDQNGNLNIGIRESNIFPEITYETMRDIFSLEVTVVTNAGSKEKGFALLKQMGFPIKS